MAVVRSLPILHGTLATAGPWQSLFARANRRVYPYQLGGLVKTLSTGTTATLHTVGDFAASDYLIACAPTAYGNSNLFIPDVDRIALVNSVNASARTLALGAALSLAAGDYLLNIGPDGATNPIAAPDFDGSTIDLYTDDAADNANSNPYLVTGTGGFFTGWVTQGLRVVDLLVRNNSGDNLVVRKTWNLGANAEQLDIRGTDDITSGNLNVTVTHGLVDVNLTDIQVTPTTAWGSALTFWIELIDGTQFRIHMDQDPTPTVTFHWLVYKMATA